jgi:hypothetical protein
MSSHRKGAKDAKKIELPEKNVIYMTHATSLAYIIIARHSRAGGNGVN